MRSSSRSKGHEILRAACVILLAGSAACSNADDSPGSTSDGELADGVSGWQGPERFSLGKPGATLDVHTAYWMGRMAELAYSPRDVVQRMLPQIGVRPDRIVFFENTRTNTQGFYFARGNDAVLTFRGTQELRDFLTDAKAWTRPTAMGKTHAGFLDAFASVWADGAPGLVMSDGSRGLASLLRSERKGRLIVTGHSLGGALATLAFAHAAYDDCLQAVTKDDPRTLDQRTLDPCFAGGIPVDALYTFGSPRVGDGAFAAWVSALAGAGGVKDRGIFRFVHAADIVTKVPDVLDGGLFYHPSSRSVTGKQTEHESLVYLTRSGSIDSGGASVEYATDKWRTKWLDAVGDHTMAGYLQTLLAHAAEGAVPTVPLATANKVRFEKLKAAYRKARPEDFVVPAASELGGALARSSADLGVVLRWSNDVGTFFVRRSTDGAAAKDEGDEPEGHLPVPGIAPVDTDEIFDSSFELVATVEADRAAGTIFRFEDAHDPPRR